MDIEEVIRDFETRKLPEDEVASDPTMIRMRLLGVYKSGSIYASVRGRFGVLGALEGALEVGGALETGGASISDRAGR